MRRRSRAEPEARDVPRALASLPRWTVLLCSRRLATRRRRGMASLTWLGHAAFRIESDRGKRIYVDPFLQGNPKTPQNEKNPERVDIIALTHGHSDHAA